MVADLLHGGPEAAGFMTSGGTESILLAVKAARGRGRERGVTAPEMVLPTTAHAAFEKGAEYFGVRSVRVPVRDDFRADPARHGGARSTPNTVLLVASAPAYPQGVIDPVGATSPRWRPRATSTATSTPAWAASRCRCSSGSGIRSRRSTSACPGVTSMSVDLHKYGYTAEGRVGDPAPHQGAAEASDLRHRQLARRPLRQLRRARHQERRRRSPPRGR